MYIKGSNLNAVSDASMESFLSQTLKRKKRLATKTYSFFPKTKLGAVYFRLHANNDPEMYTLL